MIRVKICCIESWEEAKMAIEHGASALGLVGNMPSGPGVIDDYKINQIAQKIPPGISSFLLTSSTSAEDIINHHRKTFTSVIQIVDEIKISDYDKMRMTLPGTKLVQVIHVIDERAIEYAHQIESKVDAILLDSGNPNAKIKTLGGTGKTHNWQISAELVQKVNVPVFLAGGLNPDNIIQAIEVVNPFGVDICSGVRTNGKLDEVKLSDFFAEISKISR